MNKYSIIILSTIRNEKYGLSILISLWLLAQIIAYLKFGIFVSVDSVMYIEDAQLINEGIWPGHRNFWYSSYSFVLAIIEFLGGKPTDIVFIQVLMSGFALLGIYKLTQNISKNNISAFIATLLYVSWIKIHQWNMIVYTDSLFTSATIITIALIHFSTTTKLYLLSCIATIFTILIRPTGIGFLLAVLGQFLFRLFRVKQIKRFQKIQIVSIASLIFLLLLNFVLRDYIGSFLESYTKAELIYPNISLSLNKPTSLVLPNHQYPALIKMLQFIINNPIYFAKISLIKAFLFLAHVKPYYSIFHNVAICIFLYPIYYFMIRGLKSFASSDIKIFMIAFISFQIMTVSLTSENWDGRFLLPVLPYVFIIASFGITDLVERRLNIKTQFQNS